MILILDWTWQWEVSFGRGTWLPNAWGLALGFLDICIIPKEVFRHSQRAQYLRLKEIVGLDRHGNLNMASLEQLNKDLRGEHAN